MQFRVCLPNGKNAVTHTHSTYATPLSLALLFAFSTTFKRKMKNKSENVTNVWPVAVDAWERYYVWRRTKARCQTMQRKRLNKRMKRARFLLVATSTCRPSSKTLHILVHVFTKSIKNLVCFELNYDDILLSLLVLLCMAEHSNYTHVWTEPTTHARIHLDSYFWKK